MTAEEVRQVVERLPKDMPILIDEAYHHFVDDPAYGTAVPYVLEGRPVIVARTFSKIAALAAMRSATRSRRPRSSSACAPTRSTASTWPRSSAPRRR